MKVYISADLEGAAGIVERKQGDINNGGVEFEAGRRLMMGEVNAAIQGALDAGATEIVVNDGHSHMRNMLQTELNPIATLIQGHFKPLSMAEGLDASFDAALLIGYHGGPGSRRGVLNHAFHAYALRCNGEMWTETGLTAMVAGHFGVPVVLVTGDRATVQEAEAQIPGVRGVVVKDGLNRIAAKSVHPDVARRMIREGVVEAVQRRDTISPVRPKTPIRMELETFYSLQADAMELIPTVERIGDRAIAYESPDGPAAYRTFLVTYYMSIPWR